jgi:hypothetical protein
MILNYDDAFTMVSDAHAVRVNDSELLYPDCDEDDNTITIASEDGCSAWIIRPLGNMLVGTNADGELVFKDEHGEDVTLMLLVPKLVK